MSVIGKHLYQFGVFAVDTDQRIVLREGKPLPLAPKLFETLLILVEHNGRIVSKDELMSRLWPETFVEDSNLTFNIQQLRKSLGDNARNPAYIGTVARRGYRFIAGVEDLLDNVGGNGSRGEQPFSDTATDKGWPLDTGKKPDREAVYSESYSQLASASAADHSPATFRRITAWLLTLGMVLVIV